VDINRLAVLESGEPAVRVLAAVGNLSRRTRAGMTTTLVHAEPERPWYAREADDDLALADRTLETLTDALVRLGVDMVWPGPWGEVPAADLVAACEELGIGVVGPDSDSLRMLTEPDLLVAATEGAGVRHRAGPPPPDSRVIEVDVLADAHGVSWAFGMREVTVAWRDQLLLAETPAPDLSDELERRMLRAATAMADSLGFVGASVMRFGVDVSGQECWLSSVDPHARPEHALVEDSTGASYLGLRLRVAAGEHLDPDPPAPDGWAVEVRLLALDPDHGHRPSGGRVEMLDLPVGTGVRVDASLRVGDVVDGERDPVIATMSAWGHDRREAFRRLGRAVERTSMVLQPGTTNRSELLALLERPELVAGAVTRGWYGELEASGALVPDPDPMALVAAAVESYEADLAVVRSAFLASARRGRPENPEEVGTRVHLEYRGSRHRLRVDRTGPETYRILDGSEVRATVERVGRFERRVTCRGRKRRVVAVAQRSTFRIEIDGVAHVVTRVDGVPARAEWPALVSRILVSPGDRVAKGDPVAVLESMKMVSTVLAPFSGEVLDVDVVANTQVERGAPLFRLRADLEAPETAEPADVGLSALADPAEERAASDPQSVYRRLTHYLLGYDLDPAGVKRLMSDQEVLASLAPDDPALLAEEDAFVDLFAEIGGLYRPRTEGEVGYAQAELTGSTQEYLLDFLQWLDAERAGLPERYRQRLRSALERYGVHGLEHTDELEAAVLWMFRSFTRVPLVAPFVITLLHRRQAALLALRGQADAAMRLRLERLAAATQGRQQAVADLARDVEFQFFDEPVMAASMAEVYAEMDQHLAALRADPHRTDKADRVNRLVGCPQPMRAMMLGAWLDAGESRDPVAFRAAVQETYARRFYRVRDLHGLDRSSVGGRLLTFADYEHEGTPVHLVVAYLPLEDLTAVAGAVAAHLESVPPEREVVVDLVAWTDEECPDIEDRTHEVGRLIDGLDFGRRLHRLDFTITSLVGGSPERERTHHLTYRESEDRRFTEDLLYRNLHPMLGKRLDLWRLSNFDLERLSSPEDIYLFHGIAKENPRDHRLFALAEVRDLVRVTDPETGRTSCPGLGRVGLESLAAIRAALARFQPRERPMSNRLVLSVRPTWDIPPQDWRDLAMSYEGLARGAGLEKLVLHVQIPAPDGSHGLLDKVLFLEGIGKGLLTMRLDDPGPDPVRPRTAYAQKVLTSERFGVPYPYEIVRLLTVGGADAAGFPPGEFTELDLDEDGETLVPVDREPGRNSAHLVVGLLTNHTAVVPEGVTRVALLSDPTQGLGNLAEPECRRINAALALAAERRLPVEWYAVSSGALIAMESGTENMDWIALTLRRIIEFTQGGGEINIVVTGINVGGQPYWNAEATMLMHTRGILVMTPASAMVLTGKQALDFSGAVSADDNFGIGGYDRVMGQNGQGQYWAPSFSDACSLLLQHYGYAYVVPGERFPRRRPTSDPAHRDVCASPHDPVPGSPFITIGEVFGHATNPERKLPFDMRSVMRAVADTDCRPLERWAHWADSDTSIVWDASVGGIPVCMLGLESRNVPRRGFVPSYGPPAWTAGTLFPQSSRKTARAINACSGNRPLVVLANLSGFDGSPESMRYWQLEYGAEIGRAVTNFDGPIVFVVVSRYHGGAFVVFSKALTESIEIAAVEGSFASVIGGAPAAATVFARETKQRTDADPRVREAREAADAAAREQLARASARVAEVTAQVRSEKLGEVAAEFDSIHTIDRALRVGSVDRIIAAHDLRPYVIDALERGMARFG
jgi:acetyl/propionyl-CoA carboxylase alpha subunit/acetyl-CoA carboxylase carboxyltransferase component